MSVIPTVEDTSNEPKVNELLKKHDNYSSNVLAKEPVPEVSLHIMIVISHACIISSQGMHKLKRSRSLGGIPQKRTEKYVIKIINFVAIKVILISAFDFVFVVVDVLFFLRW